MGMTDGWGDPDDYSDDYNELTRECDGYREDIEQGIY